MAQMLRTLVLLSALSLNLPLGAHAHMEMRWPYSFRSKFNPANTNPDYDNTFPLVPDGSNYPCKGYQDLPGSQEPVVTYTPGQTYNLTLAGTATHDGGSCQISLSYDDGKSFHVIKSMIGGCPLKLDWDFTIPTYAAPSDSVILAWTWFNIVGNREMYMQCARVAIAGSVVRRHSRITRKRQTSLGELPEVFTCNIGNGCQTLEDHEVVFPNPGSVIETGVDAIVPSAGSGFLLNGIAPSSVTFSLPPVTTVITTVISVSTTTDTTTDVTLSTSVTVPSITTAPFAMPNMTSPGAFYGTGTGYGTGRHNVTRTITLTQFINGTSIPLISNSSAPTTTLQSGGGMFKTITIISTLPPMPFLSGTTGTATTSLITITKVVPLMPNVIQPTVNAAPSSTTFSFTNFATIPLSPIASTLVTSIVAAVVSASSAPSQAAASSDTGSCTPGAFSCTSLTTFSQCISTGNSSAEFVSMGNVAEGMQCVDGAIIRENAGSCAPNGALQCDGSTAFYRCVNGGLLEVGSVAEGLTCTDGEIGPAR